jgi:hypothetical protein
MTVSTERFMHRPVDAIRITDENIEQVAAWCQGEVKIYRQHRGSDGIKPEDFGKRYIELAVSHPTGRRRAKAFSGDWLVSVKASFKVYNHRAFESTFKDFPHGEDIKGCVNDAFVKHDEHCCTTCYWGSDAPSNKSLVEEATRRILDLL